MLTIRLRRMGAKKNAHFRVVVADRAAGRDGPFLEILGHYHPRSQPAEIVFDMDRTESWLGRGAQMSDTVRSLYRRVRSGRVEAVPTKPAPSTPPVEEEQLAAAAAAEASEAPAVDESAADESAADEASADGAAGEDAAGDKV